MKKRQSPWGDGAVASRDSDEGGRGLDASVLLAFAQHEVGDAQAEALLENGASCSAANWSEVAQKVRAAGRDWGLVRALLISYDLTIETVTEHDAEWAAQRWRKGELFTLADRLCLTLGERLDDEVWTADTSWGSTGRVHQLR